MENPIERIMREKNLSARDLAIFCDMDVTRIRQFQGGDSKKLSRAFLDGCSKMGYSENVLQDDYSLWRNELVDSKRREIFGHKEETDDG